MKKYFFLFLISIITINVSATHIMGGEITWECIKDPASPFVGRYIFTLKVYRDCDGTTISTVGNNIEIWNHPTLIAPGNTIPVNFVSSTDISPSGDSFNSGYPCLDCNTNPIGAVEEYIFRSAPVSLPGSPPAAGWHFTWDSCCRNGAVSNIVLSSTTNPAEGFTLRASMFPYYDISGNLVPADPCFDSSPTFEEEAKTILCAGYPFSYSNLGFDGELDSMSYHWDEPLDDFFGSAAAPFNPPVIPTTLPWVPPYTMNAPIPGGVTLNNQSGEISYNSSTTGNFVSVLRVDAFKCSQKVASIYREIQVVLMNCGTLPNGSQNLPPVISAPIGTQTWITNINPSGLPSYETTVYAGDSIYFSVFATDNDINVSGNMQNLTLDMVGGQFDPTLAISDTAVWIPDSSAAGYSSIDFYWQTNCDHIQDLGCGIGGGVYTFNIKAYDDFCPANGISIATITINLIPPQPDLRCLAVDPAGGVDLYLNWPEGLTDANIKYNIHYSKQIGGPYAIIDSIFYPDTTFYHAGSDANTSKSHYYLRGPITCGTNDTLSTILMEVNAINFGNTADLNWNPIHNPLLFSSSSDYDLHYINANSSDNIIAVLPDTLYQKDRDHCNYFPEFYVEIGDNSGCVSRSSIGSVHLHDTISPITPYIENISVNLLGQSEISWVNSPDTDFYIIYIQDNNGAWITLDSVSSVQNTYIYQNSQASSVIESFSVRAVDSCGNSRVKSLKHNSMLLTNTSDACDYSISLDWNEYINWVGGTNHYKVLITETDENNVITITEVRVQGETELIIEDIGTMSSYIIVVEAYNSDSSFVAISNQIDFSIALANKPLFNYIEYATINHDDGSVDISCIVDLSAVIDRYDVYRSLRMEENFLKIGNVNFSNISPINYNDADASTDNHFYQYKIYPVDTCGVSLVVPPINLPNYINDTSFAQTILLEAEINLDYSGGESLSGDYTNTLVFNEYDKWLGNVARYHLYRSINGEPFNLLPIKTWNRIIQPDEELKYIDVVTEHGNSNGRFCYYIEAEEGVNNPYGSILGGSKSNIACVSQTPIIFIPSVFTPNGDEHNEVFKPITYFVSEDGYSFSIYNREGEMIFETNNPQKGWDGSFLGSQVQNEKYVYHLQFLNGLGEVTDKTGVITLVR